MVTTLNYQKMPELKNQIVCLSAYDMCSILWLLGEREMNLNSEYSGNISRDNKKVKADIEKKCKQLGIPEAAYSDWYKDHWGCED